MRQFIRIVEGTLFEAQADLSRAIVKVLPISDDDGNDADCYRFDIPLGHDANLRIRVTADNNALNVDTVWIAGADTHPDRFSTTNQETPAYANGVRLGTAEMRRVIQFVLATVRKDHPKVRKVEAERITGARYMSKQTNLAMTLPEEADSLLEAEADLANATYSSDFPYEYNFNAEYMGEPQFDTEFEFSIPLDHGATLRILALVADDLLKIDNIWLVGSANHPDTFATTNQDGYDGRYKSGVRLGTKEMRRIMRYVLDTVREEHPEVRRVVAKRITGARHASGHEHLSLALPEALEESADLERARVRIYDQGLGCDRYMITIPLDYGAELFVVVIAFEETLEVRDIRVEDGDLGFDHPDRFKTTNPDGYEGNYSVGIRLGTAEMRRVLRFVLNTVREKHPEVRKVSATRITGARHVSGKEHLSMALPEDVEASLCEAEADLATATYTIGRPNRGWSDDFDRYVFQIPVSGESMLGLVVYANDSLINVDNIMVEGPSDHPDGFETTNQDGYGGSFSHGVRLGTVEMRKVFRYVLEVVRKRHPHVRKIEAKRITGARHQNGKAALALDLPGASA